MASHPKQSTFILTAITLVGLSLSDHALAKLIYQTALPTDYDLAIDTRFESECRDASLANTICLPPGQLIAGHNRLANFSGLFWLLGTAGINGSEHIVVIGEDTKKRDFMAGWLYVAGQSQVTVVDNPLSELLTDEQPKVPGRLRSTTRQVVFTAEPRTQLLLLKTELKHALESQKTPVLFDGRSESEYWGQSSTASRGGHIPGAIHLKNPSTLASEIPDSALAYANDSVTGLAYLARLKANHIDAKLYLGGWVEWAADGSLPVDAASYPLASRRTPNKPVTQHSDSSASTLNPTPVTLIAALVAIALFITVGGYQLGRRYGVKT